MVFAFHIVQASRSYGCVFLELAIVLYFCFIGSNIERNSSAIY